MEFPNKTKKSLIAIGLINIDVIAEVTKELLIKYNYDFENNYFKEKNTNYIDELEQNPKVLLAPGGSLQNSLRVTKWILNMNKETKNNYKVSLIGIIGDEERKKIILNELNELGINQIFEINKNSKCSRCGVGIYNNERHLQGENNTCVSEEFIEKNLIKILDHDIIIFESFMIGRSYNIYKKLSNEFNKKNSLVGIALGANFIVSNFYDKIIDICNNCHFIFSNLQEIESLAKEKNDNIYKTIESAHKKLSEKNRLIITTCGKNPVIVSKYDYKRNKMDFILKSFPNLIEDKNIVDTNGAGDSFLAGFIAGFMKGDTIEKCCKIGNFAAENIIKHMGCTFDKNEIIDFE